LHSHILSQFGVGADAPCADSKLLVPAKRSREYRVIRPRIPQLLPVDSWQEDGLHFFVFRLRPADHAPVPEALAPLAVFAMHPDSPAPVSAVVVTPSADGMQAEVRDLRAPDSAYTVPLPQ
jgi:hypothetical protein